jgi:hypothetical protein
VEYHLMTWAGESGPVNSGLYTYTDDGSPGELVGNPGDLVMWEQGVPEFMPQASITGSAPLSLSQIQDVDINGLTAGQVLKWNAASGAWVASSDIAGSGAVNAATPPTTDNAIVRWDGTTGDMIQNSNVIVSDTDDVTTSGTVDAGGYNVDGIPLNIDHLADVSTSGAFAPSVNEFLGWNGSQWVPSTPEGQGGPRAYATGSLDTVTTSSTTFITVPDMSLLLPSGNWHVLYSSTGSHNKNGQFAIAAIFVDGVEQQESVRELGGQADNRGNFNCQALVEVTAPTGALVDARYRSSGGGGGPLASVFERLLIAVEIDIISNGFNGV